MAACTSRTTRVGGIALTATGMQTGLTATHVVIWSGWLSADNAGRLMAEGSCHCPRCGRKPHSWHRMSRRRRPSMGTINLVILTYRRRLRRPHPQSVMPK